MAFIDFDPCLSAGLMCIKEMSDEELSSAEMSFSVPSSSGQEINLMSKYSRITPDNKAEYIKMAMNYRYIYRNRVINILNFVSPVKHSGT